MPIPSPCRIHAAATQMQSTTPDAHQLARKKPAHGDVFLSRVLPTSTSSPQPTPTARWIQSTWKGEPAWISIHGSVQSVVSEQRERLVYLGSVDGTLNLLNAPYPQVLPNDQQRWPNQGGHRFWLGPQKRWVWPPIADWEYAAANSAETTNGVLTLRQPRQDPAYPAITREYAWEDGRLRCTARWQDHGRAYYGMHVIPVDLPFVGRAHLATSIAVPHGFIDVQMDGPVTTNFLPHPAVTLDEAHATLRGGFKVIKAGFLPQPLTIARRGQWQLTVLPGPVVGVPLESPDHGYLSQIWVGSPEHDLAELEQLTPYLRGDDHGECASTIFLMATPPAANS